MTREHRPSVVLELAGHPDGWEFCLVCGKRWPCGGTA